MAEGSLAKLGWILAGAIVGGAVSLSYKKLIEPLFELKPDLELSASSKNVGLATFIIRNSGKAAATDVTATVWAVAPFDAYARVDEIDHTGGVQDADCEIGLYEARLMAESKSALPQPLQTETQAALVRCDTVLPGAAWIGSIAFSSNDAVFGFMTHIKDANTSRSVMVRFSD